MSNICPNRGDRRVTCATMSRFMPERILMRVRHLLPLVVVALFAAPTTSSAATLAPEVEDQFQAIIEHNYRGGVTDPATSPPCGGVCSDLWAAEQRATASGETSVVQKAMVGVRSRVGTLPAAWRMVTTVGRVNLGVSAFTGGFLLGSYLNKKLFHIGIAQSPDGAPGATWYYFTGNRAQPFPSAPNGVGGYPVDAAFYWEAYVKDRSTGQCPPGSTPCSTTITDPSNPYNYWPHVPAPFREARRSTSPTDTWTVGYLTIGDITAGALTDYDGQPYNYTVSSPPDPGTTVVSQRVRTELEADADQTVTDEYNFQLGVPEACDPDEPFNCNPPESISLREREKRCELGSKGENRDPDPSRSTNTNDDALYEVHQMFIRREYGTTESDPLVEVALRKGWTAPHAVKEWAGWGWRHIFAKHGWSVDDVAATQEALTMPPVRDDDGALVYVGPEYTQDGERCARRVVVRDATRGEEPTPAGIITSYGALIT